MSNLTKEQIEALKKEHGEVYSLDIPGGDVFYFKPLGRIANAEIQRGVQELMNKSNDEVEINDAAEDMVIDACLISPTPEEFKKLHETRAGLRPAVVEQIYSVSGFAIFSAPTKL